MEVKIFYKDRQSFDGNINDANELEKIINDNVIAVNVNGEIYFKLGSKFYYIPTGKGKGEYTELLNKYKQGGSSFSNEKGYPGKNA